MLISGIVLLGSTAAGAAWGTIAGALAVLFLLAAVWIAVLTRRLDERTRSNQQLRSSRDLMRLFVQFTPAAVAMFDRDMRYIACSRRWISDYSLNHDNLVGRSHYDVFPEIGDRWRAVHERCLAGAVERCDCDPFPRADGRTDYVRWTIYPWHHNGDARDDAEDEPHEVGGIIMFTEVITDRVETENNRRLLMQELDHRVKNNLAAVLSLAEQTASVYDDMDRFRPAFLGRLRAMAQAHEALAHTRWTHADLNTVASMTLAAYMQTETPRLTLEGPEVALPSRATLPVCLALHELATNAVKYGALSDTHGKVALTWTHDERGLYVRWEETDGPPVDASKPPGMGMRLIRGLIEYELQGQVEINYRPDGLNCIIALQT